MFKKSVQLLILLLATTDSQAFATNLTFTDSDKTTLVQALKEQKYGSVSSLLIAQGDNLLFEFYAPGIDKDTLHNTRSVGKTVTAILAGIAIAHAKIPGPNASVVTYFKELQPFKNPDPRKDAMTLGGLMNMSNPLECSDWNSFSRGNEERMYIVEDWSAFFLNLPVRARPSWEISDKPKYPTAFSYCTAGAQMVGEIVQRATGADIADFSQRYLFSPLGIKSAKWNRASTGTAHMGGGLELKSADWLKLAQLIAWEGVFAGNKVLTNEWVEELLTPRSQIEEGMDYGYFFWLPEKSIDGKPVKIGMMSGTGGNRIYSLPEHDIAIALTKNAFRDRQAHETSDKLFEEQILQRLGKVD